MYDEDNFVHLVQLFFAAHPRHQQENAKVCAHAGIPDGYFVSMPMAREWRLLTRKDANRLIEVAQHLEADQDPATVISLIPRVMGTPPQLQPTVLSTEIYAWLYLADADVQAGEEVAVLTMAVP